MDNSNPVILEISSDDETSFGEAIGSGGSVGEDHNWLSELLHEVDEGRDDSDDVVFVDEVVVKPKRARLNSSNSSAKTANYDGDNEDDECVILENDPDKQLTVSSSTFDEEDSDDLVVVGEKGQVACRDFPHPRHLCVTYPFASTAHGTHCKQCHCYVCDSLAPCLHWGLGISSMDHCHATDKEEFWKTQRKNMKKGDKKQQILDEVPPMQLPPHQPNSSAQQQILDVVPNPSVRLPPPPNSLAQNRDFNQVTACPRTQISIPNITNQGRSQPSVPSVPRYRYQPHLISKQLHSTNQQSVFSTKRRQNGVTSGPQFMTPCTAVRNSGPPRVDSVNNRPGYGVSRNSNASQLPNNIPLPRWQPQVSSQTQTFTNSIPHRPQVSSQPHSSSNLQTAVFPRPQIAARPPVRNHFESTTTPHRPLVTRPVGGNSFSLPPPPHFRPVGGNSFSLPPPPPHYASSTFERPLCPTSSLSNTSSTYGYEQFVSPQNQLYASPTDGHNIFQLESQTQNSLGIDHIGISNQQIPAGGSQFQNPVTADNYQSQTVATEDNSNSQTVTADNYQSQTVATEDNSDSQSVQPETDNSNGAVEAPTPAPADNFSFTDGINSGFSHDTLDFGFDSWFENQSVPGAFEVFSVYSPEPGTIDSGTLFDF